MTIMLVVDTETDGLKETQRVWEIAGVLYDTQTRQVLRAWSSLIKGEPLPKAIEQLSRMETKSLRHGIDIEEAVATLARLEALAEVTVAHNVGFDRAILERLGFRAKRWLCSMEDIPYPEGISKKLTYLALEHGIPVVAANAHRALDDAMLVIQILKQYDFDHEIVPFWQAPRKRLVVKFKKNNFKARSVIKRFGFTWNQDRVCWQKSVRDHGDAVESMRTQLKAIADLKLQVEDIPS